MGRKKKVQQNITEEIIQIENNSVENVELEKSNVIENNSVENVELEKSNDAKNNCSVVVEKIVPVTKKMKDSNKILEYNKRVKCTSTITKKPLHTRWRNCHRTGKINELSFKFSIHSN